MPSRKQVRWAQLRVGITVVVASLTLMVLIFLMSGTSGVFTRSIYLKTYFANAGTLREGAPVRLQGVDIGNVKRIRYNPSNKDTPVEVTLKVSTTYPVRKDTMAFMTTAGVLGEAYVDLDSSKAKGPLAKSGDILQSLDKPDFNDLIKASQGSLENLNVILRKMDVIVTNIQEGKGSVGKLINDPELFNRANKTLAELQKTVEAITRGQGSVGKLVYSDELYNKFNAALDKLNNIVDDINAGKGNAGKFLKDETLFKNANETVAKFNRLMSDIDEGRGTLGKIAKDQEFAKKVDSIVTKLSLLADRLEAGEGSVGKLFKDPSLYTNADQMLIETRGLVKAIRENPKKYLTIHFRIF